MELVGFSRQDGKGGSTATATWNAKRTQVEFTGAWAKVPPLPTKGQKRPNTKSIYRWIVEHGGDVDAATLAAYGL